MRFSYSLSFRTPHGDDDDRSGSLDFETDDLDVVVKEFNKLLMLCEWEQRVRLEE